MMRAARSLKRPFMRVSAVRPHSSQAVAEMQRTSLWEEGSALRGGSDKIPSPAPLPETVGAVEKMVAIKLGAPQEEWTKEQVVLYSELRALRRILAGERKVALYQIFANKVIDAIVSELPRSRKELLNIKGVGPKVSDTLVKYSLLSWCQDVRNGVPLTSTTPVVIPTTSSSSSSPSTSSKSTLKSKSKSGSSKSLMSATDKAAHVSAILASTENTMIGKGDLNDEQRQTASRALDGRNVFITGSAGTGKSYLLKYIIQELQMKHGDKAVAVTASTGIAAVNLAGQTVHSFAGIGLGKGDPLRVRAKVLKDAKSVQRWTDTEVLVIDEISMIDRGLFELLDSVARSVKGNQRPFGGIQVVLVGDFLQLPPVQGRDERQSQSEGRQFCFESPLWDEAGLSVEKDGVMSLRQIVRQQDAEFASLLNEARLGKPSARLLQLLDECHVDVKPRPTDGIVPTKLYCVNKDVDQENSEQLASLEGEVVLVSAFDVWKTEPVGGIATKKVLLDLAEKTIPAEIALKVGAQVMLTRNRPQHSKTSVMNGSRGIVVGFVESSSGVGVVPRVKFDNGENILVSPVEFKLNGPGGDGCLIRMQVPLKLAWCVRSPSYRYI